MPRFTRHWCAPRLPASTVACVLAGIASLLTTAPTHAQTAPRPPRQGPQPLFVRAVEAAPAYRRGEVSLLAGDEALQRGDLRGADAAFREALHDVTTTDRAAEALTRLHRRPGFRLASDEAAMSGTQRLLGADFRRVETPHFVILSDCGTAWTNARGRILERTRDQFFRVAARMGISAYPHEHKLVCVLFADREMYRAFAAAHDGVDAGWVAGYYSTSANRIVFYNDESSPELLDVRERLDGHEQRISEMRDEAEQARRGGDDGRAAALAERAEDLGKKVREARDRLRAHATAESASKTVHEAVHLLSFNTGLQRRDREYPFWLSEGLACSFETAQPERAFGPDRAAVSPARQSVFDQLAVEGKLAPLASLIRVADLHDEVHDDGGHTMVDSHYGQSAVLFSHLFARDPKAVGRFFAALSSRPPARDAGHEFEALFREHFGAPETIEKALRRGR